MIPFLNEAGRLALPVASSMLWQTAVLAMALLLVEVLAGRRLRATLRCGLWLLVIVKLFLPPSLKSPLSPGYWIGRWITPPLALPAATTATTIAQVNPVVSASIPFPRVEASEANEIPAVDRTVSGFPRLNAAGALMGLWILGSVALAFGVLRRNQQVRRLTGTSRPASADLLEALRSAATELGLRRLPELRLTQADHSPAVSGFLHPVIVLPAELAAHLTPSALRDVLLHELIHVRRRDLWLNLPQALVQIVWWWNPFVWLANARIRLLREQAVDEQVMLLTHGEEESTYPATLVAVARYCADRPVLTLSFVGILESRHHLRSRVERLLNAPLPQRAGLGRLGWLTLVLTACLALPMAFARRVDSSVPGAELSARVYRFDPDRLMAALEERVSYTVEDFSVDDLPSNHGGDFSGGPRSFIPGTSGKHMRMESRIRPLLGKYFAKAGVTFAAPNPKALVPPQKAFSFDAASGTLVIRASDAELLTIDHALQGLSLAQSESRSADPDPDTDLTSAITIPTSASSPIETPDSLQWLPWSEDKVRIARHRGQTVLVDFTAKWCFTCRVNRAQVLHDPKVRQRLTAGNIITLTADYTHENPKIAEELRRLNRPGVPAVVIYPGDPDAEPIVLPEVLSLPIVLDALPAPAGVAAPEGVIRLPEELQSQIGEFLKATGVVPIVAGASILPAHGTSKLNPDLSGWVTLWSPGESNASGREPTEAIHSTLGVPAPSRPANQIQLRIFELDPKNGSIVLLESAEIETREQVLSGTTSQRQPGDAFIDTLRSSKRRTITELVRPAPSGRRIDISFAEANVTGAPDPNAAALELLPVVRPGEATVDLFVVLRRSPNDPVPIRRSATLKPGESLVIVSGYPTSEAGTKPLLFAMTPSFEDLATLRPEVPAKKTSGRRQ